MNLDSTLLHFFAPPTHALRTIPQSHSLNHRGYTCARNHWALLVCCWSQESGSTHLPCLHNRRSKSSRKGNRNRPSFCRGCEKTASCSCRISGHSNRLAGTSKQVTFL